MNFIKQAQAHVDAIIKLADAGTIQWREETPPRPDAMRAFSGSAPGYNMMICQANIKEVGIVHEGMVIVTNPAGPLVIHLPREIADQLYHQAAIIRN